MKKVLSDVVTGQWRPVAAAGTLGALHQACEAAVPLLIGVIVDEAVATGDGTRLGLWIGLLGAVFLVLSNAFRFSLRAGELAAHRAEHDLRVRLARRVLAEGGVDRLSGELASIATGDAQRVGRVNAALPTAIAAVVGLLVGAVALLRVSTALGLLVLVAAPLMLGLAHLLGKPLERRSDAEQDRAAAASGVAADLVAGIRALKGIGAEAAAAARYRGTSAESAAAAVRAARSRAWLDGWMLAVTGVFLAVVALVGGRLAANGEITVGQLVAAVGLAQFLLWPLTIFSWVNGLLAQARASAARVGAVLDAPPAVPPGSHVPPAAVGDVALVDVVSGPLRGVSFSVSAGEFVGVVADDPAEASALLALLAREVDPESGAVLLDGVALSEVDGAVRRSALLVASHEADLFGGTVLENVLDGGEHVAEAVAAARVDDVARALPDGMGTAVSERGRSLSGGQRQRVALARALAAAAPVLVLHDPTTAVDAVTEVALADGVRRVRAGRTTVVVAASPALLAAADRVVHLSAGVVVAQGAHADLVTRPDYRSAVLG
ncbi:ABC transporter transmembrane domain-containing protein [Actinosynnema mirum]|uniref:ABC transporter related n=1 Tax=Actinosynnema mirum (strain ATCC 29888 / DSM 43827 / JCM 3225 / NBRC 14064 / NCIMB 13271 / NRRL B-12336 / IMRU 3971 / 101) TaxID=446462 RepID=C6WS69_ACTMD|nr:ABC transporter ATP-binding protein [Actinosynnema mirum]ACU38889.1 ABC transporter related [Actinosynnema mirum DSM 43827]AXX32481.1 bifunctional ABC transporter [Actinosynnema pretiosum subsp. pretiosum]